MIDITVNELNKYYGSNHVIKGISFEINSGEKVGLLGKNGDSTTTLFKTITDEEYYEGGNVIKASGKKVEVLAQIPIFGENDTVDNILYSSFDEVMKIHEAMKQIEGDCDSAVLQRYGKLMDKYERLGGYDVDVKIEKICNGMSIDGKLRQSPFRLLSGGEKTRVNLARILLRDCDILLLDEPTNHLDLTSLAWLERFLRDFRGTVVVISHDRAFLDNTVKRIIEIDSGKINFYSGNYSFYVEERRQRYLTQAEQYKQQQRKINQLEVAIKRQRVWIDINPSNTGLAKRALAMEKRIEQMDKVEKPTTSRKMTDDFNLGGHIAKELVTFDLVRKSYGTKVLLDNVSISIGRNDRIALIGANGCGKTTLIRLLTGEEACDSGTVKVSSNVKIAYMPQIIVFDNENATVLETLKYQFDLTEEKSRSILARFRFKAPDVLKQVGNLSGGEKSRLKLCLLMQSQVNFLILDEPTNHLDIESREWIEDAVFDWGGTMLFISHDRYFLNKFASRIWSMADGHITDFHGNFENYMETIAKGNTPPLASINKKNKKQPAKTEAQPKKPTVEILIFETEDALKKIDEVIELTSLNADYEKLGLLCQEKHRLEARLETLYSEWVNESGGGENA